MATNLAGRFELAYNDRLFPTLHISPYYVRLLKESDDEQVSDYLVNKLRQTKWTMRAAYRGGGQAQAPVGPEAV